MDARPLLEKLARALHETRLEAILIGNAAAALHGAPVTTVDFDFYFRKTPGNLQKLKSLTKLLNAVLMRPYYPVSDLYRLIRESDGLQVDFMATIHGVRSFASLRAASEPLDFAGHPLLVASLAAILRSKRAAARPRDKAVLDILESALHEEEARDQKTKARRPQGRKRP
jgi:hypothetical protein